MPNRKDNQSFSENKQEIRPSTQDNQSPLYMFSKDYNIDEAYNNIRNLNFFFFVERFNHGLNLLSNILNLPLNILHEKKSTNAMSLDQNLIKQLNYLLKPEFELYNKLYKLYVKQHNL